MECNVYRTHSRSHFLGSLTGLTPRKPHRALTLWVSFDHSPRLDGPQVSDSTGPVDTEQFFPDLHTTSLVTTVGRSGVSIPSLDRHDDRQTRPLPRQPNKETEGRLNTSQQWFCLPKTFVGSSGLSFVNLFSICFLRCLKSEIVFPETKWTL